MHSFICDGSMEGVLTAVFEYFERHGKNSPDAAVLHTPSSWVPDAFSAPVHVHSDAVKAARVWKGLGQRLDRAWLRRVFCCYLSEQPEALMQLFSFCNYVFLGGAPDNYGNAHVQAVASVARSVEREKHRMEAFIRFEELEDGLFYAAADPDFNVLPLIAKHFRDRFADQQWLIYDRRRQYGLHFKAGQLEEITLETAPLRQTPAALLDEKEALYAQLWKDYFKSTNIPSRKNMKLHIQHVPKRYWKYLTEKLPS
ncbi:DNA metabolism protein [Pedobacter yulinensis]|uniref:DNA metabolism protein n=1 Tax=Pedobacter yulinensis TaxID=2126353 RepID=A0A2T3HRV8_9SPHI|nr:TIGR03915 family putative DNA repair protein [Pedobacter yulinensis]PST85117.1 DNA metabolism protein [Pedobacter yulinensis]